MILPPGCCESHRIKWYLSNQSIIWNHHCNCTEQSLQTCKYIHTKHKELINEWRDHGISTQFPIILFIYLKMSQKQKAKLQDGVFLWNDVWAGLFLVTFRLSGSSALPAYPGFMVINTQQVGLSESSVPSNINVFMFRITACWILKICCATTDNTSTWRRATHMERQTDTC